MRTLKIKRAIARFGSFLFVLLLAIMTPLVAAASSLDTAPDIGPAGIFTAIGILGLGTVISLKAKDAAGNKRTFTLDTEKPQEVADTIDQYAELKVEESIAPLNEKVTSLSAERDGFRDILVGEIVRLRKLTAPKSEGGEADFDAEAETAYLSGLPVERLKMEWQRLPKREEIAITKATTSEAPDDPADPYKEAYA